MLGFKRSLRLAAGIALAALLVGASSSVAAASAADIDADVDAALGKLYREVPGAKDLASRAEGVLVFPSVIKGGFLVGGQFGEGALRKGGRTAGYYNIAAVSYGLQAGAQSFGYALFLMSNDALDYLVRSDGWEVGTGPSVVVLDEGLARTISSTTAREDVYAVVFGQKGLMGGVGLQGSKITPIEPGR
jgi:lipid-binding SYLF domain-containing protein